SASATSVSFSAPRRRSRSKTPFSLLDSASNIVAACNPYTLRASQNVTRRCASLRGAAEPPRSWGDRFRGMAQRAGTYGPGRERSSAERKSQGGPRPSPPRSFRRQDHDHLAVLEARHLLDL